MPPKPPLQLILDEQLPWRLASELRLRGFRTATAAYELGQAGKKDPDWLQYLASLADPYVLVTFDNKMPDVHGILVKRFNTTLAIIDSRADRGGLTEAEYYRDVTHRWAHRMEGQRVGLRRKYSRGSYWTIKV